MNDLSDKELLFELMENLEEFSEKTQSFIKSVNIYFEGNNKITEAQREALENIYIQMFGESECGTYADHYFELKDSY